MRWLKRLVVPLEDRWPLRTPPTVPSSAPPSFHCRACKAPLADDARSCPSCGTPVDPTA